MTAFALAIWKFAKPLLPYLAVVALIAGAGFWLHQRWYNDGLSEGLSERDKVIAQTQEATAKAYTQAAQRVMTVRAMQTKIDKEVIHDRETDLARLHARYDGLRQRYLASGTGHVAVPISAASPGGFAVDAQHPGFWTIRAADALSILEACDGYVSAFDHLADWAQRQSGVSVDIPTNEGN